jgi:hypothetical protein
VYGIFVVPVCYTFLLEKFANSLGVRSKCRSSFRTLQAETVIYRYIFYICSDMCVCVCVCVLYEVEILLFFLSTLML